MTTKRSPLGQHIDRWHDRWLRSVNHNKPSVPFPKIQWWVWIGSISCLLGFILLFLVPPIGLFVMIFGFAVLFIPNYKEAKKEALEKEKKSNRNRE